MRRSKSVLSLATAAVLALPLAALSQGDTPPPCPSEWQPADTSIAWQTPSANLEADAIEMRWGDCFFSGVGPASVDSDPGDPTYRTLEVDWQEQGANARLDIYFAADETDWWVTEMRTPAREFSGLGDMFKTPRGESFEGDVQLGAGASQGGEVIFHGLRLTAFAPGTGPAPLTGCAAAATTRKDVRQNPLDKGQPLHGSGITKMTTEQAEALLRDRGLCFTFRYDYPIEGSERFSSGSQRWCTAPPGGVIESLTYLPDGEVVLFVEDDQPRPHVPQPPEGMNCPAQ